MEWNRKTTSPYLNQEESTRTIMMDVLIALLPATVWGIYAFGARALTIVLLSILSSAGLEALYQKLRKKPVTVSDLSAVLTGLLFALCLPVGVPLWVVPVGAFVAVILTKQLFGGMGKYFVNPVLVAKLAVLLLAPRYGTRLTEPFTKMSPFQIWVSPDALSEAVQTQSAWEALKEGILPQEGTLSALLTGTVAGCIGEVSALLLLAGFLYLAVRNVVTWHIATVFVSTFSLLNFLFPVSSQLRLESVLFPLFSGGLLLGAVFLATDYVTSPMTVGGKVVYGALCGILTFVFRLFVSAHLGLILAILLCGGVGRYLDRFFIPRPYGVERNRFSRLWAKWCKDLQKQVNGIQTKLKKKQ